MTKTERRKKSRKNWWDDANLSRLRIGSGLVLFAYVIIHLLNHSLGLLSVDAMETGNEYVKKVVRFLPVTVALYGALAVHAFCALWRVFKRRSLKMPASEWMQVLLGLAIPFLLVIHVMGTRYAHNTYEINDSYTYVLLSTFVFSPYAGWLNASGLVAAWVHGCMGIYMWVRLKPRFRRFNFAPYFILATLIPCFALAGYLSAGRVLAPLALDGEFMGQYYEQLNLRDDSIWGLIGRDTDLVRWILIAVLALTLLARFGRILLEKRRNEITIEYVGGPSVRTPLGNTLLEISQLTGVPHASVCGGRGRCSTCRIRLLRQDNMVEPPSEGERRVLERVNAAEDVRLACQLRPIGDMKIALLLPSDTTLANAENLAPWSTGREQEVAVMFADLRDFTRTAESRLPFDVVYLINQFSQHMGLAVQQQRGQIDKFLGDGFMALFGLEGSPEDAAKDALAAAQAMVVELEVLNDRLRNDLDKPLRMGIGIHTGPVVLGDMGFGRARGLTAIGDVVNIASRLETATKSQACAVCVSQHTVQLAGQKLPEDKLHAITVRGKKDKLNIYALDDETIRQLFDAQPATLEEEKS